MKQLEELKEAYAFLFGETDGDTVLQDLEMRFHIHAPSFSSDPYETAFREGQRSVVLFIHSMMEKFNLPQEVNDDE